MQGNEMVHVESDLENTYQEDEDAELLEIERIERYSASIKRFTIVAFPFTASTVIVAAGNFLNARILSSLGTDGLAASGLVTATLLLTQGFLYPPLYAVGILAGKGFGERDKELVKASFQEGLVVSAMMSVPMILVVGLSGEILTLFGQDAAVVQVTQEYFDGYLWGCYADVFLIGVQQYALAVGHPNSILISSLFEKIIAIMGGYCLTFGTLGLPELGAYGLGLAASAAALSTCGGLTLYLIAREKIIVCDVVNLKKALSRSPVLAQLLKIGIPISIQVGFEQAVLGALMLISGLLSENELISAEVALQYYGFILVPILGASQAGGVLVSLAAGEGNYRLAKRYGDIAYSCIFIPGVAGFLMLLAYKPLTDFFLQFSEESEEDLQAILTDTLMIFYINQFAILPDFIRNVSMGNLRGLCDTAVPMWVNTIISILTLPAAYLAGVTFGLNNLGIYGVRALSILAIAILVTPRWFSKIKLFSTKNAAANQDNLSNGEEDSENNMPSTDDIQQIEQKKNDWSIVGFFGCRNRSRMENERASVGSSVSQHLLSDEDYEAEEYKSKSSRWKFCTML